MVEKIVISSDDTLERLDKFLYKKLKEKIDISRTKIKGFIIKGNVRVNGIISTNPHYLVKVNDCIEVAIREEKKEFSPFFLNVPIVYEDDDIIVVNKPSGLVVHPPYLGYNKTLINALYTMGKSLYFVNPLRAGIVHRLDKDTSGVMVLVKNSTSYYNLISQFKERKIKKEYIAVVWGRLKEKTLVVDLPISRDRDNRLKMRISFVKAKEAHTKIEVIKYKEDKSVLLIWPFTGRMHQIRVHLNFLGHPILGDKIYGRKDGYSTMFLHSRKLGLSHPRFNKYLEFLGVMPDYFKEYIQENELSHKEN